MGDRHVVDVIPDEHERSRPRWAALYELVLAGALLAVPAPGGPPRRPGRSGWAAGMVRADTEGPLTAAWLALRMLAAGRAEGLDDQQFVSHRSVVLALLALGQDRSTVLLRPAPGPIATRRLQGCLQDTTTDQIQLQLVTVAGIGQPAATARRCPAQGADR